MLSLLQPRGVQDWRQLPELRGKYRKAPLQSPKPKGEYWEELLWSLWNLRNIRDRVWESKQALAFWFKRHRSNKGGNLR